jgi:hypothetical protein
MLGKDFATSEDLFSAHMSQLSPEPIFRVNDQVAVIAPYGVHEGSIGTVTDVYVFSDMYRYVIQFETGTTGVYFGFELKLCLS